MTTTATESARGATALRLFWGERFRQVSVAPLAGFRVAFGLLVCFATVRFWANGWIEELYLKPRFFFPYYGFEWVKPVPAPWLYGVFGLLALSALGVALGAFYRVAAVGLLLTFGYIELLDKTNYLNHYYYVTMAAALLALLPAHRAWSVDAWRKGWRGTAIPAWMLWAVKLQVASVYFFGGIAKLKSDWLFEAQPLKIWLAANATLPVVGPLLDDAWVAYAVAWFACLFDLTVPFFLWRDRTRPWAYAVVIAFHLLTAKLFYIGIFPWAMMVSTWIFFHPETHAWVLNRIFGDQQAATTSLLNPGLSILPTRFSQGSFYVIVLLLFAQLLLPFRHLLYPGNLLWTEQGFRYSWNIMLIEKAGTVDFHVRDPATGRTWTVDPRRYLTRQQARMLSTQPDMLVQFAHFLAEEEGRGSSTPLEVRAEAWVTLNGRPAQWLIDPTVDLAKEEDSFAPKTWILPLQPTTRSLTAHH
jgi:Vitamin K-dependent gamma-carboxylase